MTKAACACYLKGFSQVPFASVENNLKLIHSNSDLQSSLHSKAKACLISVKLFIGEAKFETSSFPYARLVKQGPTHLFHSICTCTHGETDTYTHTHTHSNTNMQGRYQSINDSQ